MKPIRISPPSNTISGEIILPFSKSIANRLLIINALRDHSGKLTPLSEADDTILLSNILNQHSNEIDAKDAGTVFRFLTAFLAAKPGQWNLNGSERMKARPVGPLVKALNKAGAEIQFIEREGYPPLAISGKKLMGGIVEIDASLSSQFVSAILLIAPFMELGLTLIFVSKPASTPYIKMTVELMKQNGASVDWEENSIRVWPGTYTWSEPIVEKDWSASAFWFELCAMSIECSLKLSGLQEKSIQGDAAIIKIMESFHVRSVFHGDGLSISREDRILPFNSFEINCEDFPDLVPALICTSAGLGIDAQFKGLHTLQIKESDRIFALQAEVRKLGLISNYNKQQDLLSIEEGRLKNYSGELHVHNDHRIAMALAPLSVVCGTLDLDDGEVVSKSYPGYWRELESLGFKIEWINLKT